jgi:hypothetical protein
MEAFRLGLPERRVKQEQDGDNGIIRRFIFFILIKYY